MAPATVTLAEETNVPASILASETLGLMSDRWSIAGLNDSTPFPVVVDNNAGLNFDLGGSDTRKLQLLLNQPLILSTGSRVRVLDSGGSLLGLDATLDIPVGDNFNLSAGVDRQKGKARFQSLGSIRCMNGTLRADSYTASGCRFVDEPLASS